MVITIALGLLGFLNFDPRAFAENFAVFLGLVALAYFVYLFFCVDGVRIGILILEKLSQVSVEFNWNVLFFRPTFHSGNRLKQ